MNIYVAAKTHAFMKARKVQDIARKYGHRITHDWTQAVEHYGVEQEKVPPTPEQQSALAQTDARGVLDCHLLIALGHPDLCGTVWELGMAAAWDKEIWLVEWGLARHSVFDYLPQVTHMNLDMDAVHTLLNSRDIIERMH